MIRGGEKGEERREERERVVAGAWAPKAFCSPFTARRSRTRKTRGVRERTTKGTPRWSEDNGRCGSEGRREKERESERDRRGQERNGYHRQAILVALQTGKTTRNSVSETRPLLAEDEFRSFCSARDDGRRTHLAGFVRRIPPATSQVPSRQRVLRELARENAIFFRSSYMK